MPLHIRQIGRAQLTSGQLSDIRELLVRSYTEYKGAYPDPAVWENYLREIRSAVDHPHIDGWIIAEQDRTMVGSVMIFRGSDRAYNRPELGIEHPIIRFLAVDPAARGRRIGQRLVEASLDYAARQGDAYLVLHTSDKMRSAIRLYERMGFSRAEQYDFHVGDTHVKSYCKPVHSNPRSKGKLNDRSEGFSLSI